MTHLDVFDPPMCCSSGVCGPSVDPLLTAFAGDVDWLISQGVSVTRYNLAQDPQAFVVHPLVKDLLQREGDACLPLGYHRDVSRTQGAAPDAVRQLLPRLRDPRFTKALLVTVPEATPVHEGAQLQADLRRAGIEPFAWVLNQSFAGDEVCDPMLRDRGELEAPYLAEVRDRLAERVAWVPWYPDAPIGAERLLVFARRTTGPPVAASMLG